MCGIGGEDGGEWGGRKDGEKKSGRGKQLGSLSGKNILMILKELKWFEVVYKIWESLMIN